MEGTLADVEKLEEFSRAYLNWLKEWMDPDGAYDILLTHLYSEEFIWTVDRDINRAEDGCILRTRFEDESGMVCKESYIEWPCSVLEMLVALAIRIDDQILYDISEGERVQKWFWEMLGIMGLAKYDDEKWRRHPQATVNAFTDILDKMLYREYDDNGKGGLAYSDGDPEWKKLEIWVQINRYFGSKYD